MLIAIINNMNFITSINLIMSIAAIIITVALYIKTDTYTVHNLPPLNMAANINRFQREGRCVRLMEG